MIFLDEQLFPYSEIGLTGIALTQGGIAGYRMQSRRITLTICIHDVFFLLTGKKEKK
jgi:hypothetical protein